MLRSRFRSALGFFAAVIIVGLLAGLLVPGTAVAQEISGYVTLDLGDVTQVTLTLSGAASAVYHPASDGYYLISGLTYGENYTVTPSLDDYVFEPESYSYTPLSADMFDQNFQGTFTPFIVCGEGYAVDLLSIPALADT